MIRLFNVSVSPSVLLLVVSEAVLLVLCFIIAAFVAPLYEGPEMYLLYEGGLMQILLLVLFVMLGLYLNDLYEDVRIKPTIVLLQPFCLVLGAAFLIQAFIGYAKIDYQMPKWTMVIGSAIVLVSAPVWRRQYYTLVRSTVPVRTLLLLGLSPTTLRVAQQIKSQDIEMRVLGYMNTEELAADTAPGIPFMGTMDDFGTVVHAHSPDSIVVTRGEEQSHLPMQQLLDLRFSGISVESVSTTYETVMRRVSLADLRPSEMIFSGELSPKAWSMMVQNVYSTVIAAVGLIVALPIMVVVAIAVKLSSKGPVFFRQTRVGLNGVHFKLYKFRSMRMDAEARTGPVWAQKNDPRVTPIGGWLRRTRLDELPQLFNVLRGEMSMVGPRPERPEFVKVLSEQIPFFTQRHTVKPGITGWAQINHKYGDTIEDTAVKLEYDLYYIKNLTPALDALIMFHTIRVILLQRGSQ